MKKRETVAIISLVAVILAVMGATYAYFTLSEATSSNNVTISTANVSLVFEDKESEAGELISSSVTPDGMSLTRHFKITNSGNSAYVNILFKDMVNTYLDGSFKYTFKRGATEGTYTEVLVDNANLSTSASISNKPLVSGLLVPSGITYYELTISYDYSETINQK